MLSNYLRTAWRTIRKQKVYALINILGLSAGMSSVIFIMLFVRDELGVDRFHHKLDHIFRVVNTFRDNQTGAQRTAASGAYRLADELKIDFPDLPQIIRLMPQSQQLVEHGTQRFYEDGLAFVDPAIFQVFTIPLLHGDPETALADPFSLVVTREIAFKYFGREAPLGEILTLREHDFKVTGILAKPEDRTQFDFDILVSARCTPQIFSRIVLENWGETSAETFILLPVDAAPERYLPRLQALAGAKLSEPFDATVTIALQPLARVYLHSTGINSFFTGGDITYVYAFSVIALFILIIACINFMNLATARSAGRAKEVGLRKVIGAQRQQLIGQFLSETVLMAAMALIFTTILVVTLLPAFNRVAGTHLSPAVLADGQVLGGLILLTLTVGLAAGCYPALFLSAFRPIGVLSGALRRGVRGGRLRKVLVTIQFAVTITLLIITIAVNRQLRYAKELKPGYDKEHLLVIEGTPLQMRPRYGQFRAELMKNPAIINAGASSRIPPGALRSTIVVRPEGIPEHLRQGMQTIWTDFDFIETLGLQMAAGRSFSRNHPSDATTAFVLNETAVQQSGWTPEEAIGKRFGSLEIKDWDSGQWQERNGRVIGVLKDFYFESLHHKIVPTVYFIAPYMARHYLVRIKPDDVAASVHFIRQKWQEFNPSQPFVYSFVDGKFEQLYRREELQGQVFALFAGLAIVVACLGLVGLASFMAEQRTKEVGIRKVLGARVSGIIALVSREFLWPMLLAFTIATPVAWYTIMAWLQGFAYHIELGLAIFVVAGLCSLLIVWLMVSYQAIKVALTNPADALRYE